MSTQRPPTSRPPTSDVLDWNQLQPFEIGPLIIAVFAFPGANEGAIPEACL
jgi:hypothetical protein